MYHIISLLLSFGFLVAILLCQAIEEIVSCGSSVALPGQNHGPQTVLSLAQPDLLGMSLSLLGLRSSGPLPVLLFLLIYLPKCFEFLDFFAA